jgi:hypothetical protein
MAYAMYFDVPGNEQTYQSIKSEIGDAIPAGLILQVVAKTQDGLRHFEVWNSKEAWSRFRDERVQPAVAEVLASLGLKDAPPPPEEHVLELVDLWGPVQA